MTTTVSDDELRRTLTAGAGVRGAPITKLVGPHSEVYDLMAPRSAFLSVGSAPNCALVLDYPTISRRQCSIEFNEGRVVLTHWPEAKNATYVDGVPIPHWVELRFGNRLRFGDAEFIAFADSDQIDDVVALRTHEDVGTTYAAAAATLGVPARTFMRRVQRAEALYASLAGVVPEQTIDEDATPPHKHRRPRTAGERVYGVPVVTNDEGDPS